MRRSKVEEEEEEMHTNWRRKVNDGDDENETLGHTFQLIVHTRIQR